MKKQNPIQISIPEPCHEKWEEMTCVERGRFCSSCQKVVKDFTQMEDSEIIQFIKEGKGHCGRFKNEQLNRPLIATIEKPRYFTIPLYKKIAASLLIMAAFAEKTFAQQKKPNSSQQQVTPIKKSKAPVIISGYLLDFETQKPLAGKDIYLQIKGFDLQVRTTNRNGYFTFSVPANQQKGSGILSIDKTGTKYLVMEEKISAEKSITDLQLFCYSNSELLKPVIKLGYRLPKASNVAIYKEKKSQISRGCIQDYVGFPSERINRSNNGCIRIGGARPDGTVGMFLEGPYNATQATKKKSKRSLWYRITHPFKKNQ